VVIGFGYYSFDGQVGRGGVNIPLRWAVSLDRLQTSSPHPPTKGFSRYLMQAAMDE